MSTISGLPAHPLLVHFLVVLAPLTAILAIFCALWPAARRRFVWLVAALAGITAVLTPITANAGEWLEHNVGETAAVEVHEHLGKTMIYFAAALLAAAIALVVTHRRAERSKPLSKAVSAVIAVFVVVASVATTVQVFRIGHSGAVATWGEVAAD
ncbi:DUF2231 domain-containing protein [Mycolicibacterium sp.]|uniref:DUF2231 domain-containing protein n=1 Tax=Mycolicibacterium sp. TaxID=2320850 RepID=UPI0028AF1E62|nr:DUF2231 domain-containing protein [Mycolicibacterium sp.]